MFSILVFLPSFISSHSNSVLSRNVYQHGAQCSLSVLLSKLYWTDGDTINIANTDGSNRSVLFTNQKGPVGQWLEQTRMSGLHCDIPVAVGCSVNPLGFLFQASPLTLTRSSSTGSAQATAPSTVVASTALALRCSMEWRENWPKLRLWQSWVSSEIKIIIMLLLH